MDWADELDRDTRQAIVRHADEASAHLRDGATLDPADLAALVNGYELLRALVTKAKPPGHTCPAIDRVKRGIGQLEYRLRYGTGSVQNPDDYLLIVGELRGALERLRREHEELRTAANAASLKGA
jgi:hypothetical protein